MTSRLMCALAAPAFALALVSPSAAAQAAKPMTMTCDRSIDHEKCAEHCREQAASAAAADATARARKHAAMAAAFRGTKMTAAAAHCDAEVAKARAAARDKR